MKQILILFIIIALASVPGFAQFKSNEDPSVSQSLVHPSSSGNSFLGFLNPDNFFMQHNISFNYLSVGGTGVSLASYTNSMFYKISDPLNVRVDLTLQGSPFGSSTGGGAFSQGNLNKFFVSRAEFNYQPSSNFKVQLQYRELPMSYWGTYPYSPLWGDK